MGAGASKGDADNAKKSSSSKKDGKRGTHDSSKSSKHGTPEALPVPKLVTSSSTRGNLERRSSRAANIASQAESPTARESSRSRSNSIKSGAVAVSTPLPTDDGMPEVVKMGIVKTPHDLEEKDQAGNTALMRLCKIGKEGKVKILLDAGAPLNTQNMNGATAVYIAAEHGHDKCIEALVQKENQNYEDAKKAGKKGNFSGMKAVMKSYSSTSVKDISNKEGFTPVYIATIKNYVNCLQILLSNEAKTECRNEDGETPLCIAAANNYFDALKLLIFSGANKEARTSEGSTPVILAARKNYFQCVKQLLEDGANGEAARQDGWQAVHVAAHSGHLETIKLLVKHGVDHNCVNKAGRTALWMAEKKQHTAVADYLRKTV